MKIKECEIFAKQKGNVEYIEALCKRYLRLLNKEADFFENDNRKILIDTSVSAVKAELERVGKSLRLATIELEKELKKLKNITNTAPKKLK